MLNSYQYCPNMKQFGLNDGEMHLQRQNNVGPYHNADYVFYCLQTLYVQTL